MGGKLSCTRSEDSEKESKEPRPNQYEEIDDNFTIIPSKPESNSSNGVNNKGAGTYENIDLATGGKQNGAILPRTIINNQRQTTSNEIHQEDENSACYGQTDVTSSKFVTYDNNDYANHEMAMQSSSANEIQSPRNKPTNQNPTGVTSSNVKATQPKKFPKPKEVSRPVLTNKTGDEEPHDVYAQVIKPSHKSGDKSKPQDTKAPGLKPRVETKIKEPQTPPKGQQLNYIEVEFTSPPAAKKTDPSTTYTDVVHEGGRLILIK